jgi:hypothetical protein
MPAAARYGFEGLTNSIRCFVRAVAASLTALFTASAIACSRRERCSSDRAGS